MLSFSLYVLLLVSLSSETLEEAREEAREEEGTVRYCDKVFDLPDRTDESWGRCRWSESLNPASLTECEGGLKCSGECVPWQDWCSAQGSSTVWQCGSLLSSPQVCGLSAFWSGRPCGAPGEPGGSRCTGWWPGQCSTSGTVCHSVKIFRIIAN